MENILKKIKWFLCESLYEQDDEIQYFIQWNECIFEYIWDKWMFLTSSIRDIINYCDEIEKISKEKLWDNSVGLYIGSIDILSGKLSYSLGFDWYKDGDETDDMYYIQKQFNKIWYTIL